MTNDQLKDALVEIRIALARLETEFNAVTSNLIKEVNCLKADRAHLLWLIIGALVATIVDIVVRMVWDGSKA